MNESLSISANLWPLSISANLYIVIIISIRRQEQVRVCQDEGTERNGRANFGEVATN